MTVTSTLIFACAVCGAAEQTLPTNGTEVPFEGRKGATLELRAASFETRDHALHVVEMRAEPGVAMAVASSMILSAEVPLLRRTLTVDDSQQQPGAAMSSAPTVPARERLGATTSAMSVGDGELRASHTAWRSEPARVMPREPRRRFLRAARSPELRRRLVR